MDRNFLNRRKQILQSEDEKLRREEERLEEEKRLKQDKTDNGSNSSVKEENDSEGKDDSEEESDSEEKDDSEKENEENESKEDSSDDKQKRKDLSNVKKKDDNDPASNKNLNPADKAKDIAKDKIKEKLGENEAVDKAMKVKELATKAAAAVKSVSAVGGVLVKILINPIFWGIVVLLLVVAGISSTTSIIGGNDYNQSCSATGVGEVSISEDADAFTRQSAIASWLMSTPFEVLGGKPMTKEQASGILGNLIQESYGANPKAMQGDHSLTKWQTCDNSCVLAMQGGGKAVGILQWDGNAGDPRRANLARLAEEMGKPWYDLNVQLQHIKNELDGVGSHTYENTQIKRSGFLEPGKSVEEYTILWSKFIERCGKCHNEERVANANEFYSKFEGGGSMGGMSTNCVSGPLNTSDLVALAVQISYSREEKAAGLGYGLCDSAPECGVTFSKPEYIEAKRLAEETTGADPMAGMLASCDRLAATLYRVSGIDPNFPYGNSHTQLAYARQNWQKVSCQDRQPGDAIIRPGHIMVYIGMIDGKDTIASASIAMRDRQPPGSKGRSAHLGDISCRGDLFYADGGTAEGFRKVN